MFTLDGSHREKDKSEFEKFPTCSTFNFWHLNFGTAVCSVAYHASETMSWMRETEAAQDIGD